MTYTFISGASGVLGTAFAKKCAKRGDNLFLTGRSAEKLAALCDALKNEFSVDVLFYPCNLQDERSRSALFAYVKERGLVFSGLVNVAGVDIQKSFADYTQEKILLQSRVNFEAAVSLTHFVLSHRAKSLEILTVSSISGLYPMPYFAIYSATKSALLSFFSAIRVEYKQKGVKITTVMPGAIPTREDVKAQIAGQGLWGKLAAKSPEWVAERSLRAVKKNKRRYIPGFWNKMMAVCTAPIPLSWKMHFIAKRWSKIEKDAF